jgi:hypothetical protein
MFRSDKISPSKPDIQGDIRGAVLCLLGELEKGPFNPALAHELLAPFRITAKLGDFVRSCLAGRVALVGNVGNPTPSPVGQPAIALAEKVGDKTYWSQYRKSSLFEDPDAVKPPSSTSFSDGNTFARQFPVGGRFAGTISRQSFKGAGLLVLLDGRNRPCLLPTQNIPEEYRDTPDSLVGVRGEFEILSILESARSVWLKVIRLFPPATQSNEEEIERRLTFIQSLRAKGLLTQVEFDEKRRQILAEL